MHGAWLAEKGADTHLHTSVLGHPLFPGGFCSLPCFTGQLRSSLVLVLYLAETGCLITWDCGDKKGLGEEMGIVQGHMAKTSQETKSSPVFSARAVPRPVPAALTWGATNSNKMAFLLRTALGDHRRLCRVSCAMKCCSREFHGKASWASAGLGLPPVFWPSFLPAISSSPCLLSCCKHTCICARETF